MRCKMVIVDLPDKYKEFYSDFVDELKAWWEESSLDEPSTIKWERGIIL